jgi:transcriptional regulator with XRE-family HTH domain
MTILLLGIKSCELRENHERRFLAGRAWELLQPLGTSGDDMNPQETFVTRLRRQRLRARVSVEQIADALRIKPEIIAAFENNDLSEWPRGLYSRAWIRTYSLTVNLDPVDTVDEFCRLFPQGDRRAGATIQEIAAIVASPSEYRDEFGHPEGRRASDQEIEAERKPSWHAFLTEPSRSLWSRLTGASPEFRERSRAAHTAVGRRH